jgi:ATP-dependent RNA helicase RhlE
MFVEMDDKRFFLERFIKDHPDSKIIVFVRTRVRAERVAKAMERVQIDAFTIHGEKAQSSRSDVMQKFKNGDFSLLIATDVSARGIDIADVNYVINYDLPDKAENYVHRVGRTGRGVNKGIALSFCSTGEKERLSEIQAFLNKDIEVMKTSKAEYALTLDTTAAVDDIQTLIENFENRPKRKKRSKKNNHQAK